MAQATWLAALVTVLLVTATKSQKKCDTVLLCGVDATCEHDKCICPPGHHGNPWVECVKSECVADSDCVPPKQCKDRQCKDICAGVCGKGANCKVKPGTTIPVCFCPLGFTGNPFTQCRELGPQELCESGNPCGKNTDCRVEQDRSVATCSCKKGYKGDPLTGCEPECITSSDCKSHEACIGTACVHVCSPSPCGHQAYCRPKDHQAECECPHNRVGNPWVGCRQECKQDADCFSDRPVCFDGRCLNPCVKDGGGSVCGVHAECDIKHTTAVCRCPKGYTGDPIVSCRQIEASDVCSLAQCGVNAICYPKKKDDGEYIAICKCPRKFKGNALKECSPVECDSHGDCPAHLLCLNWKCTDPCLTSCGQGANCRVNNERTVVCSCPRGTTGNPFESCVPNNS